MIKYIKYHPQFKKQCEKLKSSNDKAIKALDNALNFNITGGLNGQTPLQLPEGTIQILKPLPPADIFQLINQIIPPSFFCLPLYLSLLDRVGAITSVIPGPCFPRRKEKNFIAGDADFSHRPEYEA